MSGVITITKALGEGTLLEVLFVVRRTLETAASAPVSIAVSGNFGSRMSSFVNALQGIGHEEETLLPLAW